LAHSTKQNCTGKGIHLLETPIFFVGAFIASDFEVDEQSESTLHHRDITERVIAAFYAVHGELGCGFSENVYRRATALVLRQDGLEVIEERSITVVFRETRIGTFYADIVVAGVVLVEVKAAATIENYAQAQILNYLKAAGGGVGLLLNFGRQAIFKRFVMGDPTNSLPALRAPK
jgi:GxxExxY protein